jgi:hypothetical protein
LIALGGLLSLVCLRAGLSLAIRVVPLMPDFCPTIPKPLALIFICLFVPHCSYPLQASRELSQAVQGADITAVASTGALSHTPLGQHLLAWQQLDASAGQPPTLRRLWSDGFEGSDIDDLKAEADSGSQATAIGEHMTRGDSTLGGSLWMPFTSFIAAFSPSALPSLSNTDNTSQSIERSINGSMTGNSRKRLIAFLFQSLLLDVFSLRRLQVCAMMLVFAMMRV